jgi:hypothetical protein
MDGDRMNAWSNRRNFLGDFSKGLGGLGLLSLLTDGRMQAGEPPLRPDIDPEKPNQPRPPHFEAKADQVLMIFCSGALSHVDTFDHKPALVRLHDQPMPGSSGLVTFQGENGNLIQPLWTFRPRGQSGKMTSDLLPRIGGLADDLCFIHSMTAKSNTHGPAENQMSTGFTLDGFPGIGCWTTYALGSECQDLPAFVAIPDPRGVPQVGSNHWNSAFLPAVFQGTAFNAEKPIPHLARPEGISLSTDEATRSFLDTLNRKHMMKHPGNTELVARIASYEMAARMQLAASDVVDIAKEPGHILDSYGANDASNKNKAGFARNCILARRLLERGVRFVQLFNGSYAMGEGVGNWDGHKSLKEQYTIHGEILDQPCAALIQDLKQRGMLSRTLVVFVTEFGRMPTFQKGANGRDHNPQGFTVWLAGAGVKAGMSYGATDEFGFKATENVSTIYDLHATILHILGCNHERLSFYNNGIERRLTDVHGRVIQGILG